MTDRTAHEWVVLRRLVDCGEPQTFQQGRDLWRAVRAVVERQAAAHPPATVPEPCGLCGANHPRLGRNETCPPPATVPDEGLRAAQRLVNDAAWDVARKPWDKVKVRLLRDRLEHLAALSPTKAQEP